MPMMTRITSHCRTNGTKSPSGPGRRFLSYFFGFPPCSLDFVESRTRRSCALPVASFLSFLFQITQTTFLCSHVLVLATGCFLSFLFHITQTTYTNAHGM